MSLFVFFIAFALNTLYIINYRKNEYIFDLLKKIYNSYCILVDQNTCTEITLMEPGKKLFIEFFEKYNKNNIKNIDIYNLDIMKEKIILETVNDNIKISNSHFKYILILSILVLIIIFTSIYFSYNAYIKIEKCRSDSYEEMKKLLNFLDVSFVQILSLISIKISTEESYLSQSKSSVILKFNNKCEKDKISANDPSIFFSYEIDENNKKIYKDVNIHNSENLINLFEQKREYEKCRTKYIYNNILKFNKDLGIWRNLGKIICDFFTIIFYYHIYFEKKYNKKEIDYKNKALNKYYIKDILSEEQDSPKYTYSRLDVAGTSGILKKHIENFDASFNKIKDIINVYSYYIYFSKKNKNQESQYDIELYSLKQKIINDLFDFYNDISRYFSISLEEIFELNDNELYKLIKLSNDNCYIEDSSEINLDNIKNIFSNCLMVE